MEFLNFVLIFLTGYLVLKKPEKEKTAFSLLVIIVLYMVIHFLIGSRGSILPPVNY